MLSFNQLKFHKNIQLQNIPLGQQIAFIFSGIEQWIKTGLNAILTYVPKQSPLYQCCV